jgi:O-antigen/teichoic acid export membrane protein
VGFVALTAGNALLVPAFGINGAAFAALLAMTAWSSALWLTARRSVQMDVSVLPRLRTLLAGRAN